MEPRFRTSLRKATRLTRLFSWETDLSLADHRDSIHFRVDRHVLLDPALYAHCGSLEALPPATQIPVDQVCGLSHLLAVHAPVHSGHAWCR